VWPRLCQSMTNLAERKLQTIRATTIVGIEGGFYRQHKPPAELPEPEYMTTWEEIKARKIMKRSGIELLTDQIV
jgi:hypothetical protein